MAVTWVAWGMVSLLRGLSPLVATLSTLVAAPVIAATRWLAAGSARGAASLVTEALGRRPETGAAGTILLRGDSAFYTQNTPEP